MLLSEIAIKHDCEPQPFAKMLYDQLTQIRCTTSSGTKEGSMQLLNLRLFFES